MDMYYLALASSSKRQHCMFLSHLFSLFFLTPSFSCIMQFSKGRERNTFREFRKAAAEMISH